jgi:ferredoxin
MPSVTFKHLDSLRVECQDGESIFEVALRAGRPLSSACGAKATCGLCRVRILGGEEHLTKLNDNEKKHLGNVYFITKVRLGCQARVSGDVVCEAVGDSIKAG